MLFASVLYNIIILPIESVIEFVFCFVLDKFSKFGVAGAIVAVSLAAYFTLALKVLDFPMESLSKSVAKILERVGQKSDNVITVPGILLAQWSKNFSYENAILVQFIKKI